MLKDDYIKQIEKEIKYTFKNYELLITALTHSSFANEANIESYERFEFWRFYFKLCCFRFYYKVINI